jgi:hypothetical protein
MLDSLRQVLLYRRISDRSLRGAVPLSLVEPPSALSTRCEPIVMIASFLRWQRALVSQDQTLRNHGSLRPWKTTEGTTCAWGVWLLGIEGRKANRDPPASDTHGSGRR